MPLKKVWGTIPAKYDEMRLNMSNEQNSGIVTLSAPIKLCQRIHDKTAFLGKISKALNTIALFAFLIMVLLTFVDVLLRYFLHRPFVGTQSWTEVLLVLVVSFCMPYTLFQDQHIKVELFTGMLKPKARQYLQVITAVISTALMGALTYQSLMQLLYFLEHGKMNGSSYQIIAWPFQLCIVIGCALMFLISLRYILKSIVQYAELNPGKLRWITMAAVCVALYVFCHFWMDSSLWSLNNGALALIGIGGMLLLIFSGVPTGFGLMAISYLMIGNLRGVTTSLDMLATNFYSTTSNYTWAVVAFFMLMGCLCFHADFGKDIFLVVRNFCGHFRGGLAIVTVGASTALAGIMGDSTAVAATMAKIAYPEMKKCSYDDRLSTGVIAAGSLIGPLIPPSTGFILFASLTGLSLGKLFMAGIIPGFVMAAVYIFTIKLQCWRRPEMGPPGEKVGWGERIKSLKYGLPIILIFLLVIGGVYLGSFTATEGGAIGCAGALIIGLVMRRYTIKNIMEALAEAGANLGMIFSIIIGASLFSKFLGWCNLSGILSDFFVNLHISPKLWMLIIMLFFFALGFFIDIIPMLLIGIPVLYPIATVTMGLDPFWFAVLLVMTIQAGVITPPFATILYALKGFLPHVSIGTIFKGVMPYVLATLITLLILFAFPQLIMVLPYL